MTGRVRHVSGRDIITHVLGSRKKCAREAEIKTSLSALVNRQQDSSETDIRVIGQTAIPQDELNELYLR